MTDKRQLRYSTLNSLCVAQCNQEDAEQCVCCLRHIARHDPGTIKLDKSPNDVAFYMADNKERNFEFFCRQMHLLNKERMYMCFICEPNIKKAIRDVEDGKVPSSPSLFIFETLACIEDGIFVCRNFFPILKGCICLSSYLQVDGDTFFHPIRCHQSDTLNSLATFLLFTSLHCEMEDESVLEKMIHGQIEDGDTFLCLARKAPPIEEMIAIVRWLHRGKSVEPLTVVGDAYTNSSQETSILRRCIRGGQSLQIFNQMTEELSIVPPEQHGCKFCAGCMDPIAMYQGEHHGGYDMAISASWEFILPWVTHKVSCSKHCTLQPYTIRCEKTNTIQLRSFRYYQKCIAPLSPECYREENARRFYTRQLISAGIIPAATTTMTQAARGS